MTRVCSTLLALAIACLVAVNTASAQQNEGKKKRERPNPEARFDALEKAANHDPLTGELTKDEFVKAMKATAPRMGDRAEQFFNRIKKADENKITKAEFVQSMKDFRAGQGGKHGGKKKRPAPKQD